MKIKKRGFEGNERPLQQKIRVEIDTEAGPLSLCVDPLPLGFYEKMQRELPTPRPPKTGWVRKANGKFERDENGGLIPEINEEDPVYLEALGVSQRRQNMAIIAELLSSDPELEFTSKLEGDRGEYLDAFHAELLAAGMNEAQQFQILTALNRAGGIDEAVREAKKN